MKVKQIPFPEELIEYVEKRRKKTGIGFPEYIRHLVLNDIERETNLTEEEERDVESSLRDYSKGKFTVLKSKEDIEKHFGGDK